MNKLRKIQRLVTPHSPAIDFLQDKGLGIWLPSVVQVFVVVVVAIPVSKIPSRRLSWVALLRL
jgi:hypothetical protein